MPINPSLLPLLSASDGSTAAGGEGLRPWHHHQRASTSEKTISLYVTLFTSLYLDYAILGCLFLWVGAQFGCRFLQKKVTAKEVEEMVKGKRSVPLILDFYATWCGPCILMAQELETVISLLNFYCFNFNLLLVLNSLAISQSSQSIKFHFLAKISLKKKKWWIYHLILAIKFFEMALRYQCIRLVDHYS